MHNYSDFFRKNRMLWLHGYVRELTGSLHSECSAYVEHLSDTEGI